MKMNQGATKVVFWMKVILTPIMIISFINPASWLWNAVDNVFMAPDVDLSTKALVGFIYIISGVVLFFAALKTIGKAGLGLLFIGAVIFMWFLWAQGLVAFDNADSFGWAGLAVAILVAYVGLFGTTFYRILTGRYSVDSNDPDTEPSEQN